MFLATPLHVAAVTAVDTEVEVAGEDEPEAEAVVEEEEAAEYKDFLQEKILYKLEVDH